MKITFTLLLAIFCTVVANLFLSHGMGEVGPFGDFSAEEMVGYFGKVLTNGSVWLGIFLSVAYFLLWLVLLSWVEVSWALPMNAVEYFFIAIFASLFLGESITWPRWIGIGFISVGIVFMMKSLEKKELVGPPGFEPGTIRL